MTGWEQSASVVVLSVLLTHMPESVYQGLGLQTVELVN